MMPQLWLQLQLSQLELFLAPRKLEKSGNMYPPTPAYAKAGAAPGIAVGVKLAAGFALALPWPLRTGLVTVFSAGLGTR